MPAEDLARRSVEAARKEAARYDARNGTTTVAEVVERILTAPPLPRVPLD